VEGMDCQPGTVRWHGGVPVVYPSGAGGGDGIIPVLLVVTSETEEDTGDATTQCGFEYDVYAINADTEEDDPIMEDVDPTADGHHHQRPAIGAMIPATFGYLHQESGGLKLGFINEIPDAEACEEEEE
jgi:hypothetical protein